MKALFPEIHAIIYSFIKRGFLIRAAIKMTFDYNTYYRRNLPHYQPMDGSPFFVTARLAGTLPKLIVDRIKSEYNSKLNYLEGYKSLKKKSERFSALSERTFLKYEKILDSLKYGSTWLGEERIAELVKDSFHFRDEKVYSLVAYTIMPNHIHVVFIPLSSYVKSLVEKYESKNVTPLHELSEKDSQEVGNGFEDRGSEKNDKLHTKKISESGDSLYIVTKIMQDFKKFTAGEANKILNRKGQFWQHESYDHVVRNMDELRRIVNYIIYNPVAAHLCATPDEWPWNYYNPAMWG